MKLINWIKSWGVIGWAILIFALLSSYMIYIYFDVFHDGYSDDFNKWGAFGSYFASITGLFAFLGVLYTVKQSNEQVKANEERGLFFKMLELYQKQADSISYGNVIGVNAFENYVKVINDKLVMIIIYKDIISKYQLDLIKFDGIDKTTGYYLKFLRDYFPNEKITPESNFDILINTLKSNIDYNIIRIPDDFDNNSDYYFAFADIFDSVKNVDLQCFRLENMKEVGDSLYKENDQYLGQYFRNVYYLMEVLYNFKDSRDYSKIFRAQLSRYELTLLLYNSVSSQSSPETVKYLSKFEIFNNISSVDVYLYQYEDSVNEFIEDLYMEYKKNQQNKKMDYGSQYFGLY